MNLENRRLIIGHMFKKVLREHFFHLSVRERPWKY